MGEQDLQNIINKLKNLKSFVSETMDTIIELNSKDFEKQAQETLSTGANPQGEKLRYLKPRISQTANNGYTVAYTRYKNRLGRNASYVDLNLTGTFYKSIRLNKVEKNSFIFSSTDEKWEYLDSNYGDVLGMNEPRLQYLSTNTLEPRINFAVDNYLK